MVTLNVHVVKMTVRTFVVALLAAVFLAAGFNTDAHGAEGKPKKRWSPPTSFMVHSVQCKEFEPGHYRISVTWRVEGGRYTNLGRPQTPPAFGDRVKHGEVRYVVDVEATYQGWPVASGPSTPVEFTSTFQQMVAPLRHADDYSRWHLITKTAQVTATC